jgi:hypothetical protein
MSIFYKEAEVDDNGAEEVNLRTSTGVELLGSKVSAASLPVVIASDQSAIPVSGTVTANQGTPAAITNSWPIKLTDGTTAALVTSSGGLLQYSLEEYYAETKKVYEISIDINLANTGEKMMVYFRNPNGSGKIIRLINLIACLSNTVSSQAIIRLYANPTVTANGTTATVLPAYIGGSQPSGVSLITTVPTVTANGTQYLSLVVGGGPNYNPCFYEFAENLILAANNSFLLTGNPDGVNRNVLLTLKWMEI